MSYFSQSDYLVLLLRTAKTSFAHYSDWLINNTAIRDALHMSDNTKKQFLLSKVTSCLASHRCIIGQDFVSFIRAFNSPKVLLAAPVWVWSVPVQSERADGAPISFTQLFLNGWAKEGDGPSLSKCTCGTSSFSLCPLLPLPLSLTQNNSTH